MAISLCSVSRFEAESAEPTTMQNAIVKKHLGKEPSHAVAVVFG